MTDAGLKIKISADVQAALRQLTQLTDATGELAVEGVGNITSVNEALKELRKAQQEVGDPKELGLVNRAIKDLGSEAKKLRAAGTEGFDEFGNKAQKAEGNVLGFAGTAFSALRKVAYVLPGIGVAGLIGGISSAVIDFFKSSSKEAEEAAKVNKQYFATFQTSAPLDIEKAKKTLEDYQKAVTEAVSTSGKEAAQVDILVARLQSGNTTRTETVAIIKKLQDIAPDYFSNLDAEKASINDVTKAYNLYNQELIRNVEAQIRIAELNDLVKQRIDFSRQNTNADKFVNDLLAQGKTLEQISGQVTEDFKKQNEAGALAALANKANSAELQKQGILTSKIPFGVQQIVNYLLDEKKILGEINDARLKTIGVDVGGSEKSLGNLEEILKRVAAIYKELSAPDKRPIFMRRVEGGLDLPSGENSPLVQAIDAQIEEAKKKLAAASSDAELSSAYRKLIEALNKKLASIQVPDLAAHIDFTLANPADVTKASDKLESLVTKEFGKSIQLKVPATFKLDLQNAGFDDQDQQTLFKKAQEDALQNLPAIKWIPKIQAIVDADTIARETLYQFNKAATQIVKGIAESGLSDIGIAIGDAFSGKGFDNALSDFSKVLGDGLIAIGKELILASGVIKGIKVALDSLFADPLVGIAVGIGAIAIGEVLKNSVKSVGAHAFATGGIVTGPTLGLVGEAGPEVIFPLDRLNRFIQGTRGAASTDVNVRGVISGNNIRLALARSDKQQGLV